MTDPDQASAVFPADGALIGNVLFLSTMHTRVAALDAEAGADAALVAFAQPK